MNEFEEELAKDPQTIKVIEFVEKLKELRENFGLKPKTVHVNPSDDFLTKFKHIKGLRVIPDYYVPRGNLILL